VAWWSFNGVAVLGFDSARRGGEMKRRYWERKCRRRGSPKGGGRRSARRSPTRRAERRPEEEDNPCGPVLGRKAAMAWDDFGNSKENRDGLPRLPGRIE
jgi:hypothetical protein